MLKKNKIEVLELVDGKYIPKKKEKKPVSPIIAKAITAPIAGTSMTLLVPSFVMASEFDSTFGGIYSAVMSAFDAGVVLIIIFAGASWALGHRSKAIELVLCVTCGYLLARNAVNIRDFLKGI